MREPLRRVFKLSIPIAAIALAAGCSGGGSSSSPSSWRRQHTRPEGRHPDHPRERSVWCCRSGSELHGAAVGVSDRHARRPGAVRERGWPKRARRSCRTSPEGDPAADRRRQDLHLPDPEGHQVLGRLHDEAERFRDHVRAPVHGAGPDVVLLGHRRRRQVHGQELRPLPGRGGRRQRLHAHDPPDGGRSGVPGQAGAAVRVCGSREHQPEADRQQRAAGHGPVHVAVV